MKTKILVVSSDRILLRLLQQELNNGDYTIADTQHNGDGLREVLHKELPAFIILDIMMPTLDGIGVCLHLRQFTQVPILMLSTWGAEEGMVRGLDLGSDDYLTEPFGINRLKMRISEIIQRNSAAKADSLPNIHTDIL